MNIKTLKIKIKEGHPIYFEDKNIIIVKIYEEFGLIDIKEKLDDTAFVVDIITLSEVPYKEKSIRIDEMLV